MTEPLWGETNKPRRQLTHNGQRIGFTLSIAADAWVSNNAASKRRHSDYIVGAVLELASLFGHSGDFWPALDFLVNEQGMVSRAAAIEAAIWFFAGQSRKVWHET